MKRMLAAWIAMALLIYPSICIGAYLVELKNGKTFFISEYWEEGGQVKFHYYGGLVAIEKDQIQAIRESDKPYVEQTPPPRATPAPETGAKGPAPETEVQEPRKTKLQEPEIDVAFYKKEKWDLREQRRKALEKLRQARRDRNKVAIRHSQAEITELDNRLSELAIKLKKENNGTIPAWWHMESKPGEETEDQEEEIDIAACKRQRWALMEQRREALERLKHEKALRNQVAIKNTREEIRKISNKLTDLAIKVKKANNGVLPHWWYMESKPD
jgi:hypothetical protein